MSSAPNSNEAKILARHYKKIRGLTGADLTNTNPTTTTQTTVNRTNMPNVKTCMHVKVTGVRCGSPALRGEQFCYFHQRMIRTVKGPDSRLHHVALLENDEAIQASLMEVVNALIRGTIDLKRGELILRALNTAVRNIRRARFDNATHMITQIPDYSDPAPPNGGADAPVRPSGPEAPGRCAVPPNPAAVTQAHVGTAAPGCPGGPEASGRSVPSTKQTAAVDPTQRKPPLGVKEAEAPKERKIKAHSASGG